MNEDSWINENIIEGMDPSEHMKFMDESEHIMKAMDRSYHNMKAMDQSEDMKFLGSNNTTHEISWIEQQHT